MVSLLFSCNRSMVLTASLGSSSDTSKSGHRYTGSTKNHTFVPIRSFHSPTCPHASTNFSFSTIRTISQNRSISSTKKTTLSYQPVRFTLLPVHAPLLTASPASHSTPWLTQRKSSPASAAPLHLRKALILLAHTRLPSQSQRRHTSRSPTQRTKFSHLNNTGVATNSNVPFLSAKMPLILRKTTGAVLARSLATLR
jgi:hypothetical protein